MSLASRRNQVYSDNAENAAPQYGVDKHGVGGANALKKAGISKRTTRPRNALGDISNRASSGFGDANNKKRVLRSREPRHAPSSRSAVNHAAPSNLNRGYVSNQPLFRANDLDDADMHDDDVDMSDDLLSNVRDVDAGDQNDPFCVPEYITEIMDYFKRTEGRRKPAADYMRKQRDINSKMREILIDWLIEVHLKFELRQETMFLTVNLIDRFLERRAVSRTKLQLVGCTAMLIASKYEEIYAPEVRDFVYISDKAYTREQILAMESIMLNTLSFNLTVPSSLRFAERYCRVANATEEVSHLTNYFLERTLQDYRFLGYLPSMLAASSLYLACRTTNHCDWDATLQQHTRFSETDIKTCAKEILAVTADEAPKYKAVSKKYKSQKFGQVARIPLNPNMLL